jgi:hypothetical protein
VTRVPEFHTIFPKTDGAPNVYHDQSTCLAGKSVKPEHRRFGSSGWTKCQTCHEIGAEIADVTHSAEPADPISRSTPISRR